jgi:aminopeptidase N
MNFNDRIIAVGSEFLTDQKKFISFLKFRILHRSFSIFLDASLNDLPILPTKSKEESEFSLRKKVLIWRAIIFVIIVIIVIIFVVVLIVRDKDEDNEEEPTPVVHYRLSTDIVPTQYDIFLFPNVPAKTFEGTLNLYSKTNTPASTYTLYAHSSLNITSVTGVAKYTFNKNENKLIMEGDDFSFISIEYVGSLDQNNYGWYYINDTLASTQFEPTSARKAFPCFDEPNVKSVFNISIKTNLTALSNMPVQNTISEPDGTIFQFEPTPPMCTYLVALVVGSFTNLSGYTNRGLLVKVIAEKGKEGLLEFALNESISAVEFLEDFYGINYSLPHL